MQPIAPIITTPLFPETLDALLTLLSSLRDEEWRRPTVCSGWSVKEVALHLLGGDVGLLSRQRDGFRPGGQAIDDWDQLVTLINNLNRQWIQAAQRLSPRLLCDLLGVTGRQVADFVATLDPHATGGPVSWAGSDAAPVWLDLAREYTERWHHQQHIRDAVNQPGLKAPRYLTPVLETFLHALPHTFRLTPAATGTVVTVTITGDVDRQWHLVRSAERWQLMIGSAPAPTATVIIDQETAWRLFTKGIDPATATITIQGEQTLGRQILHAVSIIA